MKIGSIGYNYSHNADFCRDYSEGLACWLFLIIKTPADFVLSSKRYEVPAGSVLLLAPGTSCEYRALGDKYTDDWIYAEAQEGDEAYLRELQIPTNTFLQFGNTEELSQFMHILCFEHYSEGVYHEEIEKKYLEILFFKISRLLQTKSYVLPQSFTEKNQKLTQLRIDIYARPNQEIEIDELAKRLGFSRSGLQHRYKQLFGVNIMKDVVQSRINCAKRLLSTTSLSVAEISGECGYHNAYYFMKQFKQYVKQTPTEYRNNELA